MNVCNAKIVCSSKKDLKKLGCKKHILWAVWHDIYVKKSFKESHEESTLSLGSDLSVCLGTLILTQTDPGITSPGQL